MICTDRDGGFRAWLIGMGREMKFFGGVPKIGNRTLGVPPQVVSYPKGSLGTSVDGLWGSKMAVQYLLRRYQGTLWVLCMIEIQHVRAAS